MAAGRVSTRLAAAILFTAAANIAFSQQQSESPPDPVPGFRDGNAGARSLRYQCTGEGRPTVIIEAGGGISFETLHTWAKKYDFTPGWLIVVPEIAKSTRVCVYDRAGLGRSDQAPFPRTSADVAQDLRALLRNEKIATPLICVGQSLGGSNCRIFASLYPGLIAGMVLVDASDADIWPRIRAILPPPTDDETDLLKALRTGPDLSRTAEWIDLDANAALLRKAHGIGAKPLIVLTASPSAVDPMVPAQHQGDWSRIHQELQRGLLSLSTRSQQLIAAKAGHNIQHEDPQLVIGAILQAVKQVRSQP
jgi:pimeloyl-ACP methyl ester carboxylesterase